MGCTLPICEACDELLGDSAKRSEWSGLYLCAECAEFEAGEYQKCGWPASPHVLPQGSTKGE
jgi:hypothetical protein